MFSGPSFQDLVMSNMLTGPTAVFLAVTAIVAMFLGPNHSKAARSFCVALWTTWFNIVILSLVGMFLSRGPMTFEGIAWSTGACLNGMGINSVVRPRLMGRGAE